MRLGPAVQIISFALILLLSGASGAISADGARAQFLGSYVWKMHKPWFGGWSGIDLSADGQHMTVISDRSHILKGQISREGDKITAIRPGPVFPIQASTGKNLTGRAGDSEGLAVSPNGHIYISFEGVARVAEYTKPNSRAVALPRPDAFRKFGKNRALEALAVDDKGRLYAVPEMTDDKGEIPVFVFKDNAWSPGFSLAGGGGYLPVGVDFGPDGRIYLLERSWNIFGFRARLRRWTLVNGQPQKEELLVQTRTGTHDNLEGVSIWRDQQGRTRVTMISDDNFLFLQRTELVEYAITE